MPHRAAVPRRAGEIGHVRGHRIVGRQQSPTDEPPADGRRDRLRDRHEEMPRPSRHAVEVGLHHDATPVQDDDAVGVGALEEDRERDGPPVGVDRRPQKAAGLLRQSHHGAVAPRDPGGWDQLADVLERPPVERRLLPVRERHQSPGGERGWACHQPELRRRRDLLACHVPTARSMARRIRPSLAIGL